jgi:hypothetical protein
MSTVVAQPLYNTNFKFTFGRAEMDSVEKSIINIGLPDVTIAEVLTPSKNRAGYTPGDRVEYAPLTATFLVNEDLSNYKEIFNWMISNRDGEQPEKCDGQLSILSSHSNTNQRVQFVNLFPSSLSQLDFVAQSDSAEPVQATVTFRYDYYKFLVFL